MGNPVSKKIKSIIKKEIQRIQSLLFNVSAENLFLNVSSSTVLNQRHRSPLKILSNNQSAEHMRKRERERERERERVCVCEKESPFKGIGHFLGIFIL